MNNYVFSNINFEKLNLLKHVLLKVPTNNDLTKLKKKQLKINRLSKKLVNSNTLTFLKYIRKFIKFFIPFTKNYFKEMLLKVLHTYTGYVKIFVNFKPIQFIPDLESNYYFYNRYNDYYFNNLCKNNSQIVALVYKYLRRVSINFVTDKQVETRYNELQRVGKVQKRIKFKDLPKKVIQRVTKKYKKGMSPRLFNQGVQDMLVKTQQSISAPTYLEVFGDIRYIQPIQTYLEKFYNALTIKQQNIKNAFTALKNLFYYIYNFQKTHFWRAFKMYEKILFKIYKLKVLPIVGIKAIFKGRFGKVRKQVAKFQIGYLRLNSVQSNIVYYNSLIRTQRGSYGYHLWFAYKIENDKIT